MILLNHNPNINSEAEMLSWAKTKEAQVPSLFELFFQKGNEPKELNDVNLGLGQFLKLSSIDFGLANIPGPNGGATFAASVKNAESINMGLAIRNINFDNIPAPIFNIIFNVSTGSKDPVQHFGTTDKLAWNCLVNLEQSPSFELPFRKFGILPIVKKHLVATWERTDTMYLFDLFTETVERMGTQKIPMTRSTGPNKRYYDFVGGGTIPGSNRQLSSDPLDRLRLRAQKYPLGNYNLSVLKGLLEEDPKANICVHFGVVSSSKYFFLPRFSPILEIKTNGSSAISIAPGTTITLLNDLTDSNPIQVILNTTLNVLEGFEKGNPKVIDQEFIAFPNEKDGQPVAGSYNLNIEISGFEIEFPFSTSVQTAAGSTTSVGTPTISELTFLDFGGACPPACPGVPTISSTS